MTQVDEALKPCRWCDNGCGWYTSYSGGFARWVPCAYCNNDGRQKPDPKRATPYGARECLVSPLPSGKHQVDTSMESGPNNCFFCEQPLGGSHD